MFGPVLPRFRRHFHDQTLDIVDLAPFVRFALGIYSSPAPPASFFHPLEAWQYLCHSSITPVQWEVLRETVLELGEQYGNPAYPTAATELIDLLHHQSIQAQEYSPGLLRPPREPRSPVSVNTLHSRVEIRSFLLHNAEAGFLGLIPLLSSLLVLQRPPHRRQFRRLYNSNWLMWLHTYMRTEVQF